jgi:hypothetical protein
MAVLMMIDRLWDPLTSPRTPPRTASGASCGQRLDRWHRESSSSSEKDTAELVLCEYRQQREDHPRTDHLDKDDEEYRHQSLVH